MLAQDKRLAVASMKRSVHDFCFCLATMSSAACFSEALTFFSGAGDWSGVWVEKSFPGVDADPVLDPGVEVDVEVESDEDESLDEELDDFTKLSSALRSPREDCAYALV
jgi:hypothetical protein